MCMNPKVSIVIPVYNGEDYINEAIDSALAQTYENCEIIVVDDGSTDGTETVVKSYGDKIRYFYKENGGVSSALNVGIGYMKGKYFQYLPHDDLLHPDKIEKNIRAIQQSGNEMSIVWSGWNFKYMDGRGVKKFEILSKYAGEEQLTNSVFPLLFSLVNTVTVLINKKFFEKVGLFNTELYTSQDYDMWFRTFIGQKTIYLNEALIDYRIHNQQGSQADLEFTKNCVRMSDYMISHLSEEQIKNIFGIKYRFFYYMLDFYKHQEWKDSFEKICRKFENCDEPSEGEAQREEFYQYMRNMGYNGNNVVLYCAGRNAKSLLWEFKVRGIRPRALSDSKKDIAGTVSDGVLCIAPDDIDPQNDLVIVTKDNPQNVISNLKKRGIKNVISYESIGKTVYDTLPIKHMYWR